MRDDPTILKKIGDILVLWKSRYMVFIVLISLRIVENVSGQRGRDRPGL